MIGFLNIQKASEYLGRSPRLLRGHIHEIPHNRPRSQILFDELDHLKWMTQFKIEPADVDIAGILNCVVPPRRRRGSHQVEAL